MAYQMLDLLRKCEQEDFQALTEIIDSYASFTNDRQLHRELETYKVEPSDQNRDALAEHIERCVRYYGSADLAYAYRHIVKKQRPAGAPPLEIVNDISKRLKVRQRPLGSLEARLERLLRAVAEKTFFDLSPDDQRELFNRAGLSADQQREFFNRIEEKKALFFPILMSVCRPVVVQKLVEGLVISVIGRFLGREAAKELFKVFATRFPIWAEWLGPIVWGLSLSWLAFDLQGPAYRKTVPAYLYLGLVGLKDGPEEPEDWDDDPFEEGESP